MSGGFSNAIIGGMEVLVRSAMRSANWVANTAGWRLGKDGSADLNSVVARGSLEVDGSGNSYIKLVSAGGIPTFLIRSADQPGIPSAEVYQAILQNISWHPSGVGSSYQQLELDGPAFANGSGAADYGHADIQLTGPSYDGTQRVSATILSQGGAAATNPKLFDINLKGNTVVTGKWSRPNCFLQYQASQASGTAATLLTPLISVRDTYGMFDGVATVTVPNFGTYEVGSLFTYSAQATAAGYRGSQYMLNGSTHRRMKMPTTTDLNNQIIGVQLINQLSLNQGDQITWAAVQNSGASLTLTADMWVKEVENI